MQRGATRPNHPEALARVVVDPGESVSPLELRRAAMDLLARREHSLRELSTKLRKRFRGRQLDEETLERSLQQLTIDGLLSDARYAASRARQLTSRGYGPNRIREDLRQQGVETFVNSALDDACEASDDWFCHAAAVYRKKYQGAPIVGDFQSRQKEKSKRLRFLQYRGFSAELSRKLVSGDEGPDVPEE